MIAKCRLLSYREGKCAVVQLPDRMRIAIDVTRGLARIARTFGVFDRFIEVPAIETWNLNTFCERVGDKVRPSGVSAAGMMLDALIQRIANCVSLPDVLIRSKMGALDPVGAVDCRLDAAEARTLSSIPVTQPTAH
jgi:hypothetical protein